MDETKMKKAPEEGPNGVDRWTSNGYGLTIDGIEVKSSEDVKKRNEHEEQIRHNCRNRKI